MSKLRIVSDLFLGSQELNRWQKFIFDDGFVKSLLQNSISFGIVHKSISDGQWSDFLVEQGAVVGNIKINSGVAIDINGKFITWNEAESTIVDDSQWRWIKISHLYDTRETYEVSIDANGNLVAPGGSLLSVLRGIPNNPVKVSFPNATLNTGEYEVREVTDDENAELAGNFLAETGLRLAIVGSFTPDIVVPGESKYPYQYDGVTITAVVESVSNTPPTLIDGEEFLIARVKRTGATITIEDKRSLNIYRSKDGYELNVLETTANPLIGIESIRYNGVRTTRSENLVYLAFSFRSGNWTFDSSINRITLIGGNGGKFKDTSYFTDGDFDNFRIYFKSGKYAIIKQSSISALQINLIVDSLDPDELNDDLTQVLVVTPNCEEVEIIARVPSGQSTLTEARFTFPSNTEEAKIALPVYSSPSAIYEISYRYKNFKTYSEEILIPDDEVSGYYVESAFNSAGALTGVTKAIYVDGLITLTENSSSYANVISGLTTGQIFGYEYLALDNANPIKQIEVGVNKENIIITQELDDELDQASDSDFDEGGIPFTLTSDHYISFSSTQDNLKNGNTFELQFRGTYVLNGFIISIVEDYVNPGDTGIPLYTLSASDIAQAAIDNLVLKVFWDGNQWQVYGRKSNIDLDENSSQPRISFKTIDVTNWDCNSVDEVQVSHGIDPEKIISVQATIFTDGFINGAGGSIALGGMSAIGAFPLPFADGSGVVIAKVGWQPSNIGGEIILWIDSSSTFGTNPAFDSTSDIRARVVIMYDPS